MYKSSSAKSWRKYNNRYKLTGVRCNDCSKKFYPPVQICSKCHTTNLRKYKFKEEGRLITWSTIYAAPNGFEDYLPYIVGIVELEDGERVTSQLVEAKEEDLTYKIKVQATFRKIYTDGEGGIIHYGLVFRPA